MEILFTYSKNEWINGRRNYLFLSRTITKMQIVITLLFTLSLIFLFPLLKDSILYIILFFVAVLSVLLLFFLYILQPILLFYAASKYQHPYKMQFTKENIYFETLGISSVLSWNIYNDYIESNKYFFLLQDKHNYTLIPKRVFENDDDLTKFRTILDSSLTEGDY